MDVNTLMKNENENENLLSFPFQGKFNEKGNEVGKWMTHPTVIAVILLWRLSAIRLHHFPRVNIEQVC
jgi:hypothetical protein